MSLVSSDWIEEQELRKLHQIVLGLLLSSLENAIADNASSINRTDAIGRTPLSGAAAEGDDNAAQIPLDHNANPNVMNMYPCPPTYHAADRGYMSCVRQLFEASAVARL